MGMLNLEHVAGTFQSNKWLSLIVQLFDGMLYNQYIARNMESIKFATQYLSFLQFRHGTLHTALKRMPTDIKTLIC
jgi:hypothetical protein